MANTTQLKQLCNNLDGSWDDVQLIGNTIYIYDTGVFCFTITQNKNHFITNAIPLKQVITLNNITDVTAYINTAWYMIFNTVIPNNAKL